MSTRVVVMVGTTKGAFFFHSDAARRDWTMTGPHLPGWEVYSLRGTTNGRPRIFAGTGHFVYGATIRVSDDLGESWNELPGSPRYAEESGFKLERIWQIAESHPSTPEVMYAGVEEAGLFVSRDRGEHWNEVSALTAHPTRPHWFPGGGGLCLHTVLVDPRNPRRIWVAISAVGVFRSDDGGESWHTRTDGLPRVATGGSEEGIDHCVHKMVLDPSNPDRLYMQYHGGVFRSENGGDLWEPIESGLPGNFGFPMCVAADGALFVVPLTSDEQRYVPEGRLRVYRSTDGGDHWSPVGSGLPEAPHYVGVLRDAMSVDSLDPAGICFGTTSGEIFHSADAGESWDRLPAQLPRITCVESWVTG